MLEINIVRHGQTTWNAQGRVQGHLDSDLTPAGHDQAEACARFLKDRRVEALYCSSLGRAMKTATILAWHLGVEMQPRRQLWECAWGEWEGLHWDELHDKLGQEMRKRKEDRYLFRPPEGESYLDAEQRVRPFVDEIRRAHPRGVIAVVGHAMINRLLVRLLVGLSIEEMLRLRQANCSIYRLRISGSQGEIENIEVR